MSEQSGRSAAPRWTWFAAAGVLAVALALRLAYVAFVVGDDPPLGDAIYYSAQADHIANGHFFEHPHFGGPAADHPPVTALVASIVSFGDGDPLLAQRYLMAVLGTVGVAAVMALAAVAFRPHPTDEVLGSQADTPASPRLPRTERWWAVSLIAGAIAAVYPGFWINDGLVMSETPTMLATAAVLGVGILWRRERAPSWLLGLVGAIAVLTRAELVLLVALIAWPGFDATAWWQRGRRFVAVGLVGLVGLAPWTIYNASRFDRPVLVSTNDGLTLVGAYCDSTFYDGVGFWDLSCAPHATGDQSEVSATYRGEAIDYARDHLDRLPAVVAARLGRAWGVWRPADMIGLNQGEGRPRPASRMAMWGWWLLAPAAVAGAVIQRRRGGVWVPLVLPVVCVTAVVAVTYGIVRFRLPAEVGAVVLAAVAVDAVIVRLLPTRPIR